MRFHAFKQKLWVCGTVGDGWLSDATGIKRELRPGVQLSQAASQSLYFLICKMGTVKTVVQGSDG